MTCIVGVVKDKTVWMGGDSAGVSGMDISVRSDEKVFHNGEFLFGFTSSFRMGQLLRFSFKPPAQEEGVSDYEFMVTTFVDEVRRCLKEGGFASKDKEEESGGTFLVGYRGALYSIYGDYQVGINTDGYSSVGCGSHYALGSLHTTVSIDTEARVLMALEAAEHHSAGVCAPFTIEVV